MFDPTTYQERRRQLLATMKEGLLLILGNEESPMNYTDNQYPFRQDSNFLYYFGLDQPHLAAVIDVDAGETILFGDDLTVDHIVWMGPQPSLAERAAQSGLEKTAPYDELGALLARARSQDRPVHYLPPYRADRVIQLHHWLGVSIEEARNGASPSLVRAVVAQRSIKSEEELLEIEKAVEITGAMHVAAMRAARPGMRESVVAGIIEGIAAAAGGRLSYPAIVTINGQTLHNHFHGNELLDGKLLLGDFGAENGRHYAGDITRTFPVARTFSPRQRDIYQIVLDAQLASLDSLAPGIRYLDTHLLAARRITEGLQALGLMQGDVDESVAAGAHALFFPHGLGHMMGLDVHDMEDLGENFVGYTDELTRSEQFGLRSLRLARALEPGFVLTVEPGVYFIPELIAQWEADQRHAGFINYSKLKTFSDFGGVRIEDNVAITTDGYRLLGKPIPKTLEAVEALRQEG